jgi:uncharacterized iron-regulated membrane protein
MTFRKTVFWLHLVAGVVAGLVIAVMSFTGVALAFEKEIVAWVERDVRTVTPPSADAARLPVSQLLARVRAIAPDAKPSAVVVSADPTQAVAVTLGRDGGYYVDPYTGDVRSQGAPRTRAFMNTMEAWHRWLAAEGSSRATGRALTGACNAAFLFLAFSGFYLWWPRSWSWRGVRAILWPNVRLAGKARDWNWHNAVGFWCAPVLIVLTATGMVMSYGWANALVYRAVGETPPVRRGPGAGAAGSSHAISAPTDGARPLGYDALLAAVENQSPAWGQITLRLATPTRGAPQARTASASAPTTREPGSASSPSSHTANRRAAGAASTPVTFAVRDRAAWPKFSSTTVTLDPFTGAVLRREGFSDLSTGRRLRSWIRFLHTGEALGWTGQLIAGAASLGGGVLVWTGLALGFRRFLGRKRSRSPKTAVIPRGAVLSNENAGD